MFEFFSLNIIQDKLTHIYTVASFLLSRNLHAHTDELRNFLNAVLR
jgi:hypothetical protein